MGACDLTGAGEALDAGLELDGDSRDNEMDVLHSWLMLTLPRLAMTGFFNLPWNRTSVPENRPTTPSQWPCA